MTNGGRLVQMCRRVMWAAAGAAFVVAGAEPATAQVVRVEVDVPRAVVRDIHRLIDVAINEEILRNVTQAARVVSGDLAAMARLQVRVGQRERSQFPIERERRETRSLRLGAEGWLELSNVAGDVTITAGTGTTAQVEITRVSHGRTEADADKGLEDVQVDVTERGGARATIETRFAQQQQRTTPYRVTVSYTITAPRGTRLTVKNVSGAVSVRGIRGDQEIDVVSGNITINDSGRISSAKTISGTVSIAGVDTDSLIEVGSASGSVTLRDIRARRVHASVVSGSIEAQAVTCTEAELSSMTGQVGFEGPLAARGRYSIQSYSGPIVFRPTGRVGFDLRAETFAGTIAVDPPTAVAASSSRRSLRSTLGDGGATVTLQTFTGTISIVRR
jgi:DUF4097 and DUF4098 domain-containing protein YvlB